MTVPKETAEGDSTPVAKKRSLDLTTAVKPQVPGGVPVNDLSPSVPDSTTEGIDSVLTGI